MEEEKCIKKFYLVVSNKSSRQNIGTYLRTASAFGVTKVLVVGSLRYGTHGAHGAQKYVEIQHFTTFQEVQTYLKHRNCDIFGFKHTTNSISINTTPSIFQRSSAFILDNEVPGLSQDQMAICDHFIHVPFHQLPTTSLHSGMNLILDTTVLLAIVLHQFTKVAKYKPRAFTSTSSQGKFILDPYPIYTSQDKQAIGLAKANDRAIQRQLELQETNELEAYGGSNLFS